VGQYWFRVEIDGIRSYNDGELNVNAAVTGIAIKTQPSDLAQIAGKYLNLGGLAVTLTYSTGATEDVTHYNFAAKGIVTTINGAVVTHSETLLSIGAHNGNHITVTCNGKSANTGTLTIIAPPIISGPDPQSVVEGGEVSFTVSVSSSGGTLVYTWQYSTNGVVWSNVPSSFTEGGAIDEPTLTLKNASASWNGYRFRCEVINWLGSWGYDYYSTARTLSVIAVPPVITGHPSDVTVSAGGAATFTVTATGTAPLTYQWQVSVFAVTWGAWSDTGIDSPSLSISALPMLISVSTRYRCVVSNTAGSVNSSVATLTVTP